MRRCWKKTAQSGRPIRQERESLFTMLIQTELGLGSRTTAEQIKKYPMERWKSLFHMRLENGSMQFFEESIDPGYYGHVVLLAPGEMLKVEEDIPMERFLRSEERGKAEGICKKCCSCAENRGS